ncbi:MAG: radical SAM family heme chaperone HemW [Ruminococcaceae bacterium]|nr:radical SAM family heme chaperone HemW [Oscillospiraceae bacterium]
MKKLGLYIHIPFCIKKCAYCDFYSLCHTKAKEEKYINALCKHIEREAPQYKDCEFDTVFFGGGTPSVLSVSSFNALVNTIKKHLNLTQGGEFTVEANPGTLTRDKLMAYKNAGVNRLSIGLQSTNDSELTVLGRIHTLSTFEESYYLARECGFDNISIDVMYGLPNQTLDNFSKTLDHVCDFAPEHISAYCLKIEDNTPFGKIKDTLILPSDEEEYQMYIFLCKELEKRGYKQYEISNFAKDNRRSNHNLKYWLSREYISFGPSSHSYYNGVRYSYPCDIDSYIDQAEIKIPERVTEEQIEPCLKMEQMDEYVMLKLRLVDGISEADFKSLFGTDFLNEYPSIEKFVKSGHVSHQNGIFHFTPEGFFVSNYILTEILHI